MKLCLVVLCLFGVNFALADTYKAASYANSESSGLLSLVYEAARKNVDIMVVPSDATGFQGYDENVKVLSKAAKQTGLYIVAHLKEKTRCQNKLAYIRSNLVFDRQGAIIAVKTQDKNANCSTNTDLVTFQTDFGVTFGLMMEEDLVLNEDLKGLKNFVVAGAWTAEIFHLNAPQFSATWSYTNNANLVSPSGIYAGRSGARTGSEGLRIAELKKDCNENISTPPVVYSTDIQKPPGEDLSRYIMRPLDVAAGAKGYKETVCHNTFCCEFDLKIGYKGQDEVSYGLAAFDGVRHYGGGEYIGTQSCAVFACAGIYKRSCSFGSVNNNTNISFEKLTIGANFTNESTVFPVILANQHISNQQFNHVTNAVNNEKNVKMTVTDCDGLLTFKMFGRIFDRDYSRFSDMESNDDFYNYIFTEDVQEFFDYLWIRVRILLFVVSIYILEML